MEHWITLLTMANYGPFSSSSSADASKVPRMMRQSAEFESANRSQSQHPEGSVKARAKEGKAKARMGIATATAVTLLLT